MKFGLFEQIFLRVAALLLICVSVMLGLSHIHERRSLVRVWQYDLQQEAEWTARHWRAEQDPVIFARAWRSMHDGVRFQVRDNAGTVVADSLAVASARDATIPAGKPPISGSAPVTLENGRGELILSRSGIPFFPQTTQWELFFAASALVLLAVLALFPFIRNLTKSLSQLKGLARDVADGQFGRTLPEAGNREVGALIASFNEMSHRLMAAEQQNRRLLSDISHELRSPLARVTALVDTLKRHPDEIRPICNHLQDETRLMDRLVGDIMEQSRLEAPRVELDLQRLDLAQWANQVAQQLRGRIEGNGVSFSYSGALPSSQVFIDPQRMMQVLGNLIDNALRAVARVSSPRVHLSVFRNAGHTIIQLNDNGTGIREQDLPFVFDRFYRADREADQRWPGAGLGLSICRAIVTAHGGTIKLDSIHGGGTNVTISLPPRRDRDPASG